MKRRDLIGSAGWAILALGLPSAVSGSAPAAVVTSRRAAAAIAATLADGAILSLNEGRRSGFFEVRSGTAPRDPREGLYIQGAGKYLARRWDGLNPNPDWFGAALNDAAVDSFPGIAACLALTGMCALGKGSYHCSRSPLADLPAYAVVKGQGALHTGIIVNHPTDHLISQRGTRPGGYVGGANLQGFGISRGVAPAVPASPADDRTTAHGIHMFMVSNPIIKDVYTYNNLVECYANNVLSMDFDTLRGLNLNSTVLARWYGLWIDGASPTGAFGGPSPNPSARIHKINMGGGSAAQSYGYYLEGSLQDLWISEMEAASCTKEVFIDCGSGHACGDVRLDHVVCDGYLTHGIHIRNVPQGSSLVIREPWVAGRAGATGAGIRIENSHGITIANGSGDGALSPGVNMLEVTNSSNLTIAIMPNNYVTPVSLTAVTTSEIAAAAHKRIAGGGAAGAIIQAAGGARNRLIAAGTASGQKWNAAIALDAGATNYTLDVTRVAPGAAAAMISVAGKPVTRQGNVGGHTIINPGAGPIA
jgi:hypothetical protein